MIPFHEIELNDRTWMEPLLRAEYLDCEEFSFTFCYLWRKAYHYQVARMNDYLLLIAYPQFPERTSYLFPAGTGDLKPVIEALRSDADQRHIPLRFHTLTATQRAKLEALYPDQFAYTEMRDYADYIYTAESLRTLTGKKLHGKRNHINRFMETYPNWRYEPITPANIDECRAMSKQWCLNSDCDQNDDLKKEACALEQAFTHFQALGFSGGALRAGGEIVAFSIGDPLNADTFMVHFEKAFSEVPGAYPMINQQFVIANCESYAYVNRQDDMGAEGLRKAKLSYHPFRIVEKYSAIWTGQA